MEYLIPLVDNSPPIFLILTMRLLITLVVLFFSTLSFADTMKESPLQIWKVGNRRWSVEEEDRFAKWVEKNITEDFFIRYKVPVDCADVPYAVRWTYARIAHLPAAATTKDGHLIGHWSTEWGKLPTHSEWHKDLRFRKALLHMLSEKTTWTLPLDTYPVMILLIWGLFFGESPSHEEGPATTRRLWAGMTSELRRPCSSVVRVTSTPLMFRTS